jgi:RimJ/RimL family protein N-acetyltransferase
MIETQRLSLRQFALSDRAALNALLGDDEVMASSEGGPLAREEVDTWLRNEISKRKKSDIATRLAVVRKSDSQFVGYCGLTLLPEIDGIAEYELGYRLIRSAWGNGYATEAATALRDHAFTVLNLTRLVALIEPVNKRSIRVAEKLGMKYEKDVLLPGYDHADHLYSMCNPDEHCKLSPSH